MWQTNGTVWALAYSNGVLYAGGSFTSVRPPGAPAGTSEQAQAGLAAFDATTGEFISSWRPTVTGGVVYALDVSPDGTHLYAGGTFTNIDGIARQRLASFTLADPRAPALLPYNNFKAALNGRVSDIDSTNDTVWVGGEFTIANGSARALVAAYNTGGQLQPLTVSLTEPTQPYFTKPFVSTIEQNNGRLYIGGMFNRVNGDVSHALAVVNATTGVRDAGFVTPSIQPTSYVVTAQISDGRLFISGRDDDTSSRARLEGVMAVDAATGAPLWGSDNHRCMGDTFAVLVLDGIVWNGTHAHDCSDIGGHPESSPRFYASTLGQAVDSGVPAHFYPYTSGSKSVPGSMNNVRAFATDGSTLFVGGGWASVNGVAQQDLTMYRPRASNSEPPKKVTGGIVATNGSTGPLVTWTASSDMDNRSLTYEILRNTSPTPVGTIQADSTFWSRPALSFIDTTAVPGSTVYYKIRVTDGDTAITSLKSNTIVVQTPPGAYKDAVLADSPAFYWRVDEAPGSQTVADSSTHGEGGNLTGSAAFGQSGALLSQPDNAVAFAGSGSIATGTSRVSPASYSMEMWFQTTTHSGGKMMGFGDKPSGTSSNYDRHVYMTNDGHLVFGVYSGGVVTITSPNAYNDGSWHYLVATQGGSGMALYVDGALVASNSTTTAQSYTGYVRIGGDNLNGWPSQPSSSYFSGTIDEVAYYTVALRADQVAQHYHLR